MVLKAGSNNQDNWKILGGLRYDSSKVKYTKTNEDGTFTISFKSGDRITYPKQSEHYYHSEIKTDIDENGNSSHLIYDAFGVTFTSKKGTASSVNLQECDYCIINLKDGDTSDYVRVGSGRGNLVKLDTDEWVNFAGYQTKGRPGNHNITLNELRPPKDW